MVSPIQGFIGVAAAGAQANHVAAAAGKGPVSDSNLQNSGVQQVIATEAAKGINKPFEKRTTNGEAALDASFDSNNSEGGGAGGHEEEEDNNQQLNENADTPEPQKKKLLDVIA